MGRCPALFSHTSGSFFRPLSHPPTHPALPGALSHHFDTHPMALKKLLLLLLLLLLPQGG